MRARSVSNGLASNAEPDGLPDETSSMRVPLARCPDFPCRDCGCASRKRREPLRARTASGVAPPPGPLADDGGSTRRRLRNQRDGAVTPRQALPQRRGRPERVRLQRVGPVRVRAAWGRGAADGFGTVPRGDDVAGTDARARATSCSSARPLRAPSHVGIVVGGDSFVHAPSIERRRQGRPAGRGVLVVALHRRETVPVRRRLARSASAGAVQ